MESYLTAPNQNIDVQGTIFAYREIGPKGAIPLLVLTHLTATLDEWDPAFIDELAKSRHVIAFDNRGVGGSEGQTPSTVSEMADDAVLFIKALGYQRVDLLGFSLGGFIGQVISQRYPQILRKLVLTGTGPSGGEGISDITKVFPAALNKAALAKKHPKNFLFFSQTELGQKAAEDFLARLAKRTVVIDRAVSPATIDAQVKAIVDWGAKELFSSAEVTHPVLIANGDADIMVPTLNSIKMFQGMPKAQLSIFPNSGHGSLFQYSTEFASQVVHFLQE